MVLGQEPSTFGCSVTGLNNRHTIIYSATEKPRAYIYAHKSFNIWPLDNISSRDVASALLDPNTEGVNKILLCSIYWDGRIDTFPKEATDAMALAEAKGYTFVFGGDMNARNHIYGSRSTDKRGKILEDILTKLRKGLN